MVIFQNRNQLSTEDSARHQITSFRRVQLSLTNSLPGVDGVRLAASVRQSAVATTAQLWGVLS